MKKFMQKLRLVRLFFLFFLILAWPFSGKAAESQAESPRAAIYKESCQAQNLPSAEPIYLALNRLWSYEALKQPSHKRFDEIDQSVRNFIDDFLNSYYPKSCDRSQIHSVLALLDKDNPASNMLDAGRIYMERVQELFKTLGRLYVNESLKQDMEQLSGLFKGAYPSL